MNFLHTAAAFFVVLGTLVIVHELGHFLVARWCGVKVLRFSVGMGKIVWSRRFGRDRTEWALSVLPFGGYVKMLDAREQNLDDLPPAELRREFTRQSVGKRIAIVAAGPLANFLLAIVVFAVLHMIGIPEPVPRLRAVPPQTAAYEAGLRGGELITAVNGEPVRIWSELRWKLLQAAIDKTPARLDTERLHARAAGGKRIDTATVKFGVLTAHDLEGDFLGKLGIDLARPPAVLGRVQPEGAGARGGLRERDRILAVDSRAVADSLAFVELVRRSPGKPLEMTVVRGDETGHATLHVIVTPEPNKEGGKTIGRIHAEVPLAPEMIVAADAPGAAFWRGVTRTWQTSVLTLKMLGKILVGQVSWKNITGPITIADYAGQTARIGMVSFLSFIAFVSISLGVMNLLPIPVLDGGLLLYYALEVLTGRPVPERVGELAQRAGLGLLATLMLVAIFNDIVRLMS